jgi:hypothetical protein
VEDYSYFREQYNTLAQFVAAFDGCFVFRYTKDFVPKEKIGVRYILGPKNRVLFDMVNQAKNITLPAIAIDQTNVKRDPTRVQFKDQQIIRPKRAGGSVIKIPTPIPITMDVNVSIIAKYKEDIDQIVSNFIPWCNPYFIISWKIPDEFGLDFTDELRTEVTWSGSVEYETPIEIDKSDKYKIIGNTSFNLKGWLFPPAQEPAAPIYVINNNFITLSSGSTISGYESYQSLSALSNFAYLSGNMEIISVSAMPEFTNFFYKGVPVVSDTTISDQQDHTFTFYGKRYGFNNIWYLSGERVIPVDLEQVTTARSPIISAYKIPSSMVSTYNDNIAVITMKYDYLSAGNFTFVTANSAGWAKIEQQVLVI